MQNNSKHPSNSLETTKNTLENSYQLHSNSLETTQNTL